MRIHFPDRVGWRAWLAEHHEEARHTGTPTVSYNATVEKALCFGWPETVDRRLRVGLSLLSRNQRLGPK
jgi:hypothetical protein